MFHVRALWCCLCFCREEELPKAGAGTWSSWWPCGDKREPGCNSGRAWWSKWCGAARQMGRVGCPYRARSGHFCWTVVISSSSWELPEAVGAPQEQAWCAVCVPGATRGVWFPTPAQNQPIHTGTTAVPSVWLWGHGNTLGTSASWFRCLCIMSNTNTNRQVSWIASCWWTTVVWNCFCWGWESR